MADKQKITLTSPGSEHKWTKSLNSVPALSQLMIKVWAKEFNLSKRLLQKGYSNSVESYVHDVEVKKIDEGCQVRAKCFPSMRKTESPYSIMISLSPSTAAVHNKITSATCTCKAGNSKCSHMVGLLYLLVHYSNLELKTIPPLTSKTCRPQTWHIPQRTNGLTPKQLNEVTVSKICPPWDGAKSRPLKKRRMNKEGVKSTLYCPVEQPLPANQFISSLKDNLIINSSHCQMLDILKSTTIESTNMVGSNFGLVPKGCVLSYQQTIIHTSDTDIINDDRYPLYPDFILPDIKRDYNNVLNCGELEVYEGIILSKSESKDLEELTRKQSDNPEWHKVRKQRITSSLFYQVCARKKDYVSLANQLLNKKDIKTPAMKFGIEKEPDAAKTYASVTSNNIYKCGFVVNPSCPYLGTSPDRKVCDPSTDSLFGILEIKCPDKDSYTQVDYLKLERAVYKLKKKNRYYFQVMGQMALTGVAWCDFFVWCRNDYHLERIHYDASAWHDMKAKLDIFYFEFYLPTLTLQK